MIAEVRERLAVRKQIAQKFDVERFNLRKQIELEVRQQYEIKISNRLAALENFNESEDKNNDVYGDISWSAHLPDLSSCFFFGGCLKSRVFQTC